MAKGTSTGWTLHLGVLGTVIASSRQKQMCYSATKPWSRWTSPAIVIRMEFLKKVSLYALWSSVTAFSHASHEERTYNKQKPHLETTITKLLGRSCISNVIHWGITIYKLVGSANHQDHRQPPLPTAMRTHIILVIFLPSTLPPSCTGTYTRQRCYLPLRYISSPLNFFLKS